MKKILIFVPEFPRLTETFIEREISKLVDLGNLDIKVFSIKKATGLLSENLVDKVVYRRPGLQDFVLGLLDQAFHHPQRVKTSFSLIHGKDRMGLTQRFLYFLKAFGYARLFARVNPDQLHIHFLSWPSTVGMLVSTLLDVPYSISAHARDVMVDGTLVSTKVRTARFISICNKFAWKSCIEQSDQDNPTNVYQQYHGVDASRLPSQHERKKKTGSERPYIFVGSRLVEKKGLHYVIEASGILRDRSIEHEVHIAGPGPLYADLMEKIKTLGLSDRVFIHGEGKGIPWDQVVEIYKIADIFAHPSINTSAGDADGVPNFVIEASLCKIPVVTTDAGSITDLIEHEKTGLLVEQANSVALADALERLILNPELGESLADNAYIKASEMFDIDKNVSKLEALLLS